MTADDYKLIAAVIGGLGGAYAFITRPMMSEMKALKAELKLEFHNEITEVRKELQAVEKRLNDRMDAWIVRKN